MSPEFPFMKLPLELRHKVYDFVSQRDHPNLILKEYFEKIDPDVGPPQFVAPVVQANGDGDSEEQDPEGEAMNEDEEASEPETQGGGEDAEMTDVDEDESDEDESDEDESDEPETTDESDGKQDMEDEYTGRDNEYRHILTTIKTRDCPPPIELLQINRQVHDEALEFHYSTFFVKIDVTAALAHQSFFLEALETFIINEFSPMEKVRKVKLVIVWDSEWLREKITPPDAEVEADFVFGIYLDERIMKACAMLQAAPALRHLEVDWYDTERTKKSHNLMCDAYDKFMDLEEKEWTDNTTEPPTRINVDVTFRQHVTEAGTAHAPKSKLAKRRADFEKVGVTMDDC
ncbi:hypothetical protein EG327_009786 [Venturia inaequalis]|uniref:Uncharacterized protein n=1 Tax=Venturia inaequalis TaxID=5025 RepID=A0A8H3UL22_VENIN|nr:hypothetical protein EG327_009786 [Venturia inaequalis]